MSPSAYARATWRIRPSQASRASSGSSSGLITVIDGTSARTSPCVFSRPTLPPPITSTERPLVSMKTG
jgi:hypothetical protein